MARRSEKTYFFKSNVKKIWSENSVKMRKLVRMIKNVKKLRKVNMVSLR